MTAPEPECGKTTMLDVLSRLVPKPLGASSITAAALFRTIEAARPTLFLDEADAYARENEELRAVLDAGHRRDGAVIRTVGEDHEPRQFSVWSPVALAAIGRLPGTVEGRSILIRLRRRRADEPIQPFRLDRSPRLAVIASMAARWAVDNLGVLKPADPIMPDGIHNRVADNLLPLLAVADCAGGEWPDRARSALVALSGRGDDDARRAGVQLLSDLRELFDAEPERQAIREGNPPEARGPRGSAVVRIGKNRKADYWATSCRAVKAVQHKDKSNRAKGCRDCQRIRPCLV